MTFVAATSFVWLGMVLAISFLEAPLKFRVPGVTLSLGLGIGRLVFRALNTCEVVLAAAIGVVLLADDVDADVTTWAVGTAAVLALQVVAVRPALTVRTDRVLAGEDPGGSRTHLVYIGLEVLKVVGLVATGVLALG